MRSAGSALEQRRGARPERATGLSSVAGARLSGELLVSTMPGAFLMLDAQWTCIHVNHHTELLLGKNAEEVLGHNVWDVFPEAVGSTFQLQSEAAIRERRTVSFREYFAPMRHWFDVRACPVPGGGVAVYFDEIDDAKRVEEKTDVSVRGLTRELTAQKALAELATAVACGVQGFELRRLTCDTAVHVADADAAWLCSVEDEHVRVLATSAAAPQLLPSAGELFHVPPDGDLAHALATGEVTVVEATDEGVIRGSLAGLGFSSGCLVPLLHHGQPWGFLCIASAGSGHLRPRETTLGRVRDLLQHADLQELAACAPAEPSALWQRTLDSLTRHVAVLDSRGVIVAVNDAWTRFAEANSEDPAVALATGLGADYLGVCRAAARAGAVEAGDIAEALRGLLDGTQEVYEFEYACHSPSEQRWFVMRATVVEEQGGRHVLVQHENVTARRRTQALVRRQAQLLDEIDAAVVCTDLDGTVTFWNDAAERLYGWTSRESVGRTVAELAAGPAEEHMMHSMLSSLHEHGRWEVEEEVEDRFGRAFTCFMRSSLILDEDGSRVGIIGISVDTSERRVHEENLEASRDYLGAITSSIADGLLALNDDGMVIYGNAAAARLLRRPAESLVGVPISTVLGREPGDVAAMVAGDALVRVEEDWFVSADGVRLAVDWTSSPLKGGPRGEGRVVVFRDITAELYDKVRRDKETERLRWAARIHDAIRDDRFELFAQPILDLRTDCASGCELLLRMHDEDGELVSPGDFLPAAEEHGLMDVIDRWVVRRGIEIAADGRPVHLNLSAQSIGDPGVLEEMEEGLRRTPTAAPNLTVELTETALAVDWDAASRFTKRVRDLGFRLALDDFGTGYNSFANLKRITVDEIKIDMQFVQDLLRAPASESVVRAVVSLAGDLGLRTVAEGVEDARTLSRLRGLGVDQAQGYHIGRPVPMR